MSHLRERRNWNLGDLVSGRSRRGSRTMVQSAQLLRIGANPPAVYSSTSHHRGTTSPPRSSFPLEFLRNLSFCKTHGSFSIAKPATSMCWGDHRINPAKPKLSTRTGVTHDAMASTISVADGPTPNVDSGLPQGATEEDAMYIRMCVELAKQALGKTSPNPMVGCVIVKDGNIVGRGFHPKAGEPHAEVFALREAGDLAEGATVYVSLEPCNHHGRTPPCSQALVKAKVKRVVVGIVDPNPQVSGKGIETLQNAGIEVVSGVEEELCRVTNEVFIHRMITGQPFVTLRYSMSMDGGALENVGVNTEEGSLYSKLLEEHDAVIITDAAVYDDPILLSSELGAKQPVRVILARSLDLPVDLQVFDTKSAKTVVMLNRKGDVDEKEDELECRLRERGVDVVKMKDLSLYHVLSVVYQRGACSVLLDSRGPNQSGFEDSLGQQAVKEQVVHKVVTHVAPVFVGANHTGPGFAVNDLVKLERVSTYVVGSDVVIEGYFPQSCNSRLEYPDPEI